MSKEVHKVHSLEEAKRLADELGKAIEYEITPKNPQQAVTLPSTHKRIRIRKKRWFGKVADNIEATLRLNGILLPSSRYTCRCGAIINISDIADHECPLSPSLKELKAYIKWIKIWNKLHEAAANKKILLEKFLEKYVKLYDRYERNKDWGQRDISHHTDIMCPKCLIMIGKAEVTLRIVDPPQIMSIERRELANLDVSPEMFAYMSKRLRFGSVEELKQWLDNKDAESAKAVLQKTIAELGEVNLPYEFSRITQTLSSLIGEIDGEMRARRVEWVNAVETVVRERTPLLG